LQREEVDGLHYDFRYRIVSEDKNRFSHWSEIIKYPMPDVTTPFPYTDLARFSISKSGGGGGGTGFPTATASAGGNGGNGGFGCGGGGGGGAVTGQTAGVGGLGGAGLVIITAW
jgi:hypothetical protein